MKVQAIKTRIVEVNSCGLLELLAESLPDVRDGSIVAVTSKVVSLCEGNAIPIGSASKDDIIKRDADYFLPKSNKKYGIYLTIKNNILIPSAGVDESNTNGYYVMWPENPQKTADSCWEFLRNRYKVKNVGVVITDSVPSPLRWGVTGRCIAYCGFSGLNDKVGEDDLFGRKLTMTRVNVADALAAASVLCMGESGEQTPIALVEDLPFVKFAYHPPTKEEIDKMHINLEEDLYGELLKGVEWSKGKTD